MITLVNCLVGSVSFMVIVLFLIGTNVAYGLGEGSVEFGQNTTASGLYSAAFGRETNSSGLYSAAFGRETNSSGLYSAAFGRETTASGDYSAALGGATTASGINSAAFGMLTLASGDNSVSFGQNTISSGTYTVAFGKNTKANGMYSTVFGNSNTVDGFNSVAFGEKNTVNGKSSVGFGQNNIASGDNSVVAGINSIASGDSSVSMGWQNNATGNSSFAVGFGTSAIGHYSAAIGRGIISDSYASVGVGSHNEIANGSYDNWIDTDPIFVVGNAHPTLESRHNAITILKNGNMGIGISSPTELLQVNGIIQSTYGGFKFPDGTIQTTSSIPSSTSLSNVISSLEIDGESGTSAITWDNGQATLRNHWDTLTWERQSFNILLDSDDDQSISQFNIYNDVDSSAGSTPIVKFNLDGEDSWINSGNMGIGTITPQSALQVNGYIQLDTISGSPPNNDCDEIDENSRMIYEPDNNELFVCGSDGWYKLDLVKVFS